MKTCTEYLKTDFTDAEMTDRARELAAANRTRNSLEQQKREIDSSLKGQIEAQNSAIQRLSDQISDGYEYRNIDCRVELDTPELGKKRIVRLDTGEEVKVIAMTAEDQQASLDLQDQANAEDAKGPIITPPPVPLQIDSGDVFESQPLASAVSMGGSHQKDKRDQRKRNPEAEGFADGSRE